MIVAHGTEPTIMTIEVEVEGITMAIVQRSCIELLGQKYALERDGSGLTIDQGQVSDVKVTFLLPPLPFAESVSELLNEMTRDISHKDSTCKFMEELSQQIPQATAVFCYQGHRSQWRFKVQEDDCCTDS